MAAELPVWKSGQVSSPAHDKRAYASLCSWNKLSDAAHFFFRIRTRELLKYSNNVCFLFCPCWCKLGVMSQRRVSNDDWADATSAFTLQAQIRYYYKGVCAIFPGKFISAETQGRREVIVEINLLKEPVKFMFISMTARTRTGKRQEETGHSAALVFFFFFSCARMCCHRYQQCITSMQAFIKRLHSTLARVETHAANRS